MAVIIHAGLKRFKSALLPIAMSFHGFISR